MKHNEISIEYNVEEFRIVELSTLFRHYQCPI